jgi:hypothetical protein
MSLKSELIAAAENACTNYIQPDGTRLKMGEVLPAEECEHFRQWMDDKVSEALDGNVTVTLFDDTESFHVSVSRNGEYEEVTYGYALGTRIDVDGDGQ